VRVVSKDGESLGIMSREEAFEKAKEAGLDLVLMTARADPPVCKIIDSGKYLYEQEKKEKERKKSQGKGGETKQVRLTFNISSHDLKTRAREAEKFLNNGNKVKVMLRLKGREKALGEHAEEKVEEFLKILEEKVSFKKEKGLKRKGGKFTMTLSSK